jgi:zeta-carotene desaturase
LGGRASSYEHPGTGEILDNCQHVLLGCCTNLVEFYRRLGVQDKIAWYDRLTFVEPGGRMSVIQSSGLPAPFHAAPSFMRSPALSMRDKLGILRAMMALAERVPEDNEESFLAWLQQRGQTEAAIERFWKVVLVSALNEDLERASSRYAALVFRESFLKSPQAGVMGVPSIPLTELYGAAGDYIRARGGEVRLRAAVGPFRARPEQVTVCVGSQELKFDFAVMALPFDSLARVLPSIASADPLRAMLERFETSPITGIHLWFDRQVTKLEHAVLLDRTIQWMFHKSKLLRRNGNGSYLELVVSSSKVLVEKSRQQILELALRELREFFPTTAIANVVKATVIKEVHATYSALPGSDSYRPPTVSPWPRVFLAGDWTATGWPATMEGAVRSGFMAAEALTEVAGAPRKFRVPDLPATGFMRLFG